MKKTFIVTLIAIVVACVALVIGGLHWYEHVRGIQPTVKITVPALTTYTKTKDITYCSPDGEDQKLNLYIPENGERTFPLLIYVHGGGWNSGSKDTPTINNYVPEVSRFGYVVAAIDYRLAPTHTFPAQVQDTKCAIRFLREQAKKYHIDPSRVGIIGESAGGYLAAIAGATSDRLEFKTSEHARQSDAVQAVIDIFGPTTFSGVTASPTLEQIAHDFLGGSDPDKANVGPYISNRMPPTLIIHGTDDATVPFEQSEILRNALDDKDVDHQFIEVKNGGHGFTSANDRPISPSLPELQKQILAFLAKYLKG